MRLAIVFNEYVTCMVCVLDMRRMVRNNQSTLNARINLNGRNVPNDLVIMIFCVRIRYKWSLRTSEIDRLNSILYKNRVILSWKLWLEIRAWILLSKLSAMLCMFIWNILFVISLWRKNKNVENSNGKYNWFSLFNWISIIWHHNLKFYLIFNLNLAKYLLFIII